MVFYPKTQEANKNCELLSRELKLEQTVVVPSPALGGGCIECLPLYLAVMVATPAATGIVSGSIVLVGDTVHWLERQGRCEDSYLKRKANDFKRLLTRQSEQPQHSSEDEEESPAFTPKEE